MRCTDLLGFLQNGIVLDTSGAVTYPYSNVGCNLLHSGRAHSSELNLVMLVTPEVVVVDLFRNHVCYSVSSVKQEVDA